MLAAGKLTGWIDTVSAVPSSVTTASTTRSYSAHLVRHGNGLGTDLGDTWRVSRGSSGTLKHFDHRGRKAA